MRGEVKVVAPPLVMAAAIVTGAVEEQPHTHQETGDPTPRAADVVWELSTSGPSVPFIPMDDSANITVMLRHAQRRRAGYVAANAMSSTW